jgi:hypothetical protein
MFDSPISIITPPARRPTSWRLWLFFGSPLILSIIGLAYCDFGTEGPTFPLQFRQRICCTGGLPVARTASSIRKLIRPSRPI